MTASNLPRSYRALVWVCSFLTLLSAAQTHADALPPGVVNTQNPADQSLTPQESLARITVPDGFHVTLFAGEPDLRRPIAFDIDDRGRLWVVENYSHPEWEPDGSSDRILILEDTDHDGTFDQRTVFWDQGRYLTGIALGHGGVWIANTPDLAFIPDRDRDDVPDSEPIVKLNGFRKSTNNVVNNLHWGPDGWLYGAIGLSTPSLVGPPSTPTESRTKISRGIWRYHPIDQRFEKVAEGMVNPWGADFNEYGDLFTSNTVVAHLFHIVPGMNCQRRDREAPNPYVYEQIQSITDHLHWGGGDWHSSRETTDAHSVAGGGHAHCGAMIYLGDNWPSRYRGKFFTNNLHGNRINMDHLVPRQSSYVGTHGDDFLFGNDPWFRGMSVKYGPDGGVYVSDWHDYGECHDNDGSHRSSGRIYKVVYGEPEPFQQDLQKLDSSQLAKLHLHANEWIVRHARRILHERAHAGEPMAATRYLLRGYLHPNQSVPNQLRALWTLSLIGGLSEKDLLQELQNASEHRRRWGIRLLVDRNTPSAEALQQMEQMAQDEPSAKVRLALAVSLQRIPADAARRIGAHLAGHAEDVTDAYLPLMIWYGLEPALRGETQAALEIATAAEIPQLQSLILRRLLDSESPPLNAVFESLRTIDDGATLRHFLTGTVQAREDQSRLPATESWSAARAHLENFDDPQLQSLVIRLASLLGDADIVARLQASLTDPTLAESDRLKALNTLLKLEKGVPVSALHQLAAKTSALRKPAIRALVTRNQPETGSFLLADLPNFNAAEQQEALGVLVTRPAFAHELLDAIESGSVERQTLSAFALQQLRALPDASLQTRVETLWADAADTRDKAARMAHYKALLTEDYLASGDPQKGRQLFQQTCAACHILFGEGTALGPDLTGSGRADLDYILSNLVDPNAIIDSAFRLTTLELKDGRVLSGFMEQLGDRFLTFGTQQGSIRLPMSEVASIETSELSMMPEGMLDAFSTEQIRDLVRYLASPEPVPLPLLE